MCSKFRDSVGPCGEEVKGREAIWESWGRGNRVERGSLVQAEAQSCIQWGKAAPLQRYYKAGLLGFMNKARK